MKPVVLGPGEGESMTLFGNELTIKTGGDFCLIDYLMSPGGFEQYFRDLRDAFGDGPPDVERIGEIASRYDVESVH